MSNAFDTPKQERSYRYEGRSYCVRHQVGLYRQNRTADFTLWLHLYGNAVDVRRAVTLFCSGSGRIV